MFFPRTKLVEKFHELLSTTSVQYIAVVGEDTIARSDFVSRIQESELLIRYTILPLFIDEGVSLDSVDITNPGTNLVIIDSSILLNIDKIRAFIESKLPESRVVFTTNQAIKEDNVENFSIGTISFREYAEAMDQPIDVASIMAGGVDIQAINTLRDTYIHLGGYMDHLNNPEDYSREFDAKISAMNMELFKKEEEDFLEFIRTIAMNVGDIFKEERIAKNMNISRRKVRKYTEIILKHKLVTAIGPWVENTATELSRHVKVYFSDLSYFHAALGVGYYHGGSKQGVIENFILIELTRKLAATHEIRFYRKKSGAEVSFVLTEKTTGKLTPIEVTTRSSDTIPQALRSFCETYGSRIDHAMIINDTIATKKTLDTVPVIILPHIAI